MKRTDNSGKYGLNQYKERLSIALEAAKICVFEVDLPRQLYTFFENAEAIFGVSGDDILKDVCPFSTLDADAYRVSVSEYFSHPEDTEVINAAFTCILSGRPATYEARMRAGGSGFVWCRINVTPIMENGKLQKMIGVIMDITDIKERTDSLELAAKIDHFTGLYNKDYTIAVINDILTKQKHTQHALILLDIDKFKYFNDTYGHYEGDEIIRKVSQQMKDNFRKTDIIGRFGGDEFIIFIQNISDHRWLCKKLNNILRIEMDYITCTNSVGVSFFPQDADNFDDLFKNADKALYQAKIRKEKFVFFTEIEK